jgi:putative hydrolase of the HAD superfamily
LPQVKAIIMDYIGTLANARRYTMDASLEKLYRALVKAGFPTEKESFLAAYGKAHEKFRVIRYGEFREVTNAVWVSEALRNLGFDVCFEDPRMKSALDAFFEDYINSLELRPFAENLLRKAKEKSKLGLISNFTYAPVVHASLHRLGISGYFDVVVVSGDCGWRKPHRHIFESALTQLEVKAEQAVFIGDCPLEDIKGALDAGLKAVFVNSQFYGSADLEASGQKPSFVAVDLEQICRDFEKIATCKVK